MLDEVNGWKPWQTKRKDLGFKDRNEFTGEGVDVLHFVANLLLTAGVDDEELQHLFHQKQLRNLRRQEVGYAGVGKEDGIGRAPDMGAGGSVHE